MLQRLMIFLLTLNFSLNSFSQISKEEMRQGLIIAQAISKIKMNEMSNYTSTPIEYEEFVSVSIIALQAIYKKDNPLYRTPWSLCGRLWRALDQEMRYRYEDINEHYKDIYNFDDNTELDVGYFQFVSLYAMVLCYEELTNDGKDSQEKQTLQSILKPYYTYVNERIALSKELKPTGNAELDNGLKMLKDIFNQRIPEPEWKNKFDVAGMVSAASAYYAYMFHNVWGVNENVVTCEITQSGILADKGYNGKYYLLQFGDWNVFSDLNLDVHMSSQQEHEYDIVLYKEGRCYVEHFDGGACGATLKREKVSIDNIETLKQEYRAYIEGQNGSMHELE